MCVPKFNPPHSRLIDTRSAREYTTDLFPLQLAGVHTTEYKGAVSAYFESRDCVRIREGRAKKCVTLRDHGSFVFNYLREVLLGMVCHWPNRFFAKIVDSFLAKTRNDGAKVRLHLSLASHSLFANLEPCGIGNPAGAHMRAVLNEFHD
jgi:hypothetical protein